MKKYIIILLFAGILSSCGNTEEKHTKESLSIGVQSTEAKPKEAPKKVESGAIDLNNKGIGPFKSIEFGALDNALAEEGQELFKMNCTACHKVDRKFIGPAITGVFERRSPEWAANMIIDPELMVKEDPIAKQLLLDHNGSPMANQGLTETEVRAILEYFRTL